MISAPPRPARSPRIAVLPASLVLAALACPVRAEPPARAKEPPMEEEVIVTGRRDGEPGFQEQQEYHDGEYRRLKEKFDPDAPPVPRSERLVRMPEAITTTVQGKPTLTEKYW